MDIGYEQMDNDLSVIFALLSAFPKLISLHCRSYTQGEVGVLCSGHVNHPNMDQSVPREHHLQGQDQPVDGSSEMKPSRVNPNYSVESIEQWNLVRVLTWCPRRHHSAPPASSPKCWCISPLSGSCVQSGIKITEWARCWRDRHVPTFLYHYASVRFTGKHGNY